MVNYQNLQIKEVKVQNQRMEDEDGVLVSNSPIRSLGSKKQDKMDVKARLEEEEVEVQNLLLRMTLEKEVNRLQNSRKYYLKEEEVGQEANRRSPNNNKYYLNRLKKVQEEVNHLQNSNNNNQNHQNVVVIDNQFHHPNKEKI